MTNLAVLKTTLSLEQFQKYLHCCIKDNKPAGNWFRHDHPIAIYLEENGFLVDSITNVDISLKDGTQIGTPYKDPWGLIRNRFYPYLQSCLPNPHPGHIPLSVFDQWVSAFLQWKPKDYEADELEVSPEECLEFLHRFKSVAKVRSLQ
ncbi:hypothetical protein ACQ4M3_07655 [Leptolyngbya sp. AN03gr2]|uniref:hypothetical protein n=1 Tax=unclassified Leptolyngbya TaxID=2650499 RepID=UPI003D31B2E8